MKKNTRHYGDNRALMQQQYCIILIGLLIFIIGVQTVHAQQQIAQDAYAIFERTCFGCHGPDGAFKETLLIEHSALIQNRTVVPGNPDASELYNRLVTTDAAKRMPQQQPPLSVQAINTIRNWILAGAPDWTATSTTNGQFISPGEVLNTIETHLMSLSSFDRAFARYFTMTHLYNAGESVGILQEYRKALFKLVNSLSWGVEVINPEPIDPLGTIFYIDLRHYEWDVNDGWGQIEAVYPYHISFDAPTQTALKAQLSQLQTETNSSTPSVHVDWFVAIASNPPLYHDLLSLPLTAGQLETRLGVDVDRNLSNAPGVRVWRAGFNNSGVSNNNRMVERHKSIHGAYWKSYDFAGNVGTQNIFNHPLDFTHDGGEVIFNLPNGLQGYYLVNASGSRLDAAPIDIVSNPAASDPTVRNGISCLGCHTEGMKTFEDQVRPVIESNINPTYDKAQALRLYVEKSTMDTYVTEDMETYRVALDATGGEFDDIEPISRFHEAFQGDVDAAYAAAVVGLETEAFLEKIRENVGLQNAGLLVLTSSNGSMKRDAWTDSFGDIIFALDFPESFTPPTVQTPTTPGAVVRIPDSNLRAAIAEELGKNPNAPITVEDMKRLTSLKAQNRGIQDLTGLQFATNATSLRLRDNEISDFSPIAGLIHLVELKFSRNRNISDLSPLKDLKNLEYLTFFETLVSDLSPVAGLINLRSIHAWNHSISDLSPLANLTKLEYLDFCGGNISDLTPLADLTGLKKLYLANEKVSDISPLAGSTGLTHLSLEGNDISDISPLAGLTNLKWLDVGQNNISDVSPLAGLTNLKWLGIYINEISDISPLDKLREKAKVLWYHTPTFPEGGPSIEGPWLWVALPHHYPIDSVLSEESGGAITATEVATHGAREGQAIGNSVWTSHRLPPTGHRNIEVMLGRPDEDFMWSNILHGTISIYSPRQQDTTMYVGHDTQFQVWLNGTLIYESDRWHDSHGYTDFLPVTLQQGRNVLLVITRPVSNAFFGFEPGTEYTVANPGVGYTFSTTPIHTGDTFTLDIRAEDVFDLAGWQFDIVFDPAALEAIDVSEGEFLKIDGGTTFFQSGSIDNAAGKITGLSAARISTQGVSGTGILLQVRFKAKSAGETELTLDKFQFGSTTGDNIPAGPHEIRIIVEERLTTGDVNRDGVISILDLILVAQQLGKRVPAGSAVDVNGDGVVSILDLIRVAQGIAGSPAAPAVGTNSIDAPMIEAWIAQARLEDDGSLAFKQG